MYFVTYQPNSNVGQMMPVSSITLNSSNSSVVISGLELRTAYTISVDVGTGGGIHRSRLGAGTYANYYYMAMLILSLCTMAQGVNGLLGEP